MGGTYTQRDGYLYPNIILHEEDKTPIGKYGRMELTITQMAKAEGVTERLKAENQMEWVQRMNSIRNRAEEIVLDELIYQ